MALSSGPSSMRSVLMIDEDSQGGAGVDSCNDRPCPRDGLVSAGPLVATVTATRSTRWRQVGSEAAVDGNCSAAQGARRSPCY